MQTLVEIKEITLQYDPLKKVVSEDLSEMIFVVQGLKLQLPVSPASEFRGVKISPPFLPRVPAAIVFIKLQLFSSYLINYTRILVICSSST